MAETVDKDERKQLNVKIPAQLYYDLDALDENKTDVVIRVLEKELYGKETSSEEAKDYEQLIEMLKEQIAFMQKQLDTKDSQLAEKAALMKKREENHEMQLKQVQILINENQQQREDFKLMLMPSPEDIATKPGGKKEWWQFWKE